MSIPRPYMTNYQWAHMWAEFGDSGGFKLNMAAGKDVKDKAENRR